MLSSSSSSSSEESIPFARSCNRERPIPTWASSDERRSNEYDEGDAKDWEVFGGSADEEAEAFILWNELCESFVGGKYREEDVSVVDVGGGEYGEIWDVPTGGDVGARLLILSGEVFNSGKKLLFDQVWAAPARFVELEFSGGVEFKGLVGGSELAAEDEVDDSMTTGNVVVRVLKE
jgi:hypothetical protein